MASFVDRNGHTTTHTYDALGRLSGATKPVIGTTATSVLVHTILPNLKGQWQPGPGLWRAIVAQPFPRGRRSPVATPCAGQRRFLPRRGGMGGIVLGPIGVIELALSAEGGTE